jgi:hypothetical protein
MHDIALYYPHMHFRDDAWLKAAALYWPRIARIKPKGYATDDSETVTRLSGELDFILDIDPGPYPDQVVDAFTELIFANWEALRSRYSIRDSLGPLNPYSGRASMTPAAFGDSLPLRTRADFDSIIDKDGVIIDRDGYLRQLRIEKFAKSVAHILAESGLGAISKTGWITVAPELAAVYMCALTEQVATANDLAVVTDQQRTYGIINGWDMETLASALFDFDQLTEQPLNDDEVGALYAAVAIKTVVPDRISEVPVDKIIKARRKLAAEFDAFRDHLGLLADRLTELGNIKSPSVLQARLELMVERDLRRPTQDLEEKLRQLGLEPAQAVLGLKSLELPAAAAAAASAAALPVGVSQAGLVAARLVASGVQTRKQRRQMLRSTPAGYLLGLEKQLTPGGITERLRRALCGPGKRIRPHRS